MIRLFTLVSSCFCLVLPAQSFEKYQAHRAVYEVEFDKAASASRLVGVDGVWVIETNGAYCTGYNVDYRFITRLSYDGGRTDVLDTNGKSFESGDGVAFNFSSVTKQNETIIEDNKGVASKRDDGVLVQSSRPVETEVTFEEKVLFPTEHMSKLIEEAKAGTRFTENPVYEGLEEAESYYAVSAIIGKEQEQTSESGAIHQVLDEKAVRRWPVSLSYFKTDKLGDSVPEWQTRFIMYENGIARAFKIDYGSFAIKANLMELELLENESC